MKEENGLKKLEEIKLKNTMEYNYTTSFKMDLKNDLLLTTSDNLDSIFCINSDFLNHVSTNEKKVLFDSYLNINVLKDNAKKSFILELLKAYTQDKITKEFFIKIFNYLPKPEKFYFNLINILSDEYLTYVDLYGWWGPKTLTKKDVIEKKEELLNALMENSLFRENANGRLVASSVIYELSLRLKFADDSSLTKNNLVDKNLIKFIFQSVCRRVKDMEIIVDFLANVASKVTINNYRYTDFDWYDNSKLLKDCPFLLDISENTYLDMDYLIIDSKLTESMKKDIVLMLDLSSMIKNNTGLFVFTDSFINFLLDNENFRKSIKFFELYSRISRGTASIINRNAILRNIDENKVTKLKKETYERLNQYYKEFLIPMEFVLAQSEE
jgi:hypothetical protein